MISDIPTISGTYDIELSFTVHQLRWSVVVVVFSEKGCKLTWLL